MSLLLPWGATRSLSAPPVGLSGLGSKLAAAANQDGHLEVFAVGGDGAMWHTWQVGDAAAGFSPSSPWSEWASFGAPGNNNFSYGAYKIQAALDYAGALQVFAITDDNHVWFNFQSAPNLGWIVWQDLGCPETNLPALWGGYQLKVVQNSNARLELFLRNSESGAVFTKHQNVGFFNQTWVEGWTPLSHPTTQLPAGQPALSTILALPYSNGDMEVIGLGESVIYHIQRDGAPGTPWGNWSVLSQSPVGSPLNEILVVSPNADGRYELIAKSGNEVWDTWQALPPSPNTWSHEWSNLGMPLQGVALCDMHLNSRKQLDLVALNGGALPWETLGPPGGWTAWAPLRDGQGLVEFNFDTVLLAQTPGFKLLSFFAIGILGDAVL
ncbi:PLL family lectin, partial [Paraburkholderia sediminicola]|uniref:hypothetical protein n=1 Tax=Paraburkholderia sediminicola TaxID=458836 RepID=UPI0038BA44D3